ncbi:EKC/KEOPS complex subunit TPRKB [Esox lucius]|uniref:EKC/KEOPS complex subunit TPRKB n=1 Tax=Esox lucius TaxID=8010 RepID=C1BYK7_ESOLU|nr:EKC/KEOPS complex subunit TPRKB [Esox lucius]ACO14110.1 TP53RK-binding protein [Esox lucius]
MQSTHEFELFPDHSVTQLLFKDVKNASELRKNAMEGKINGALINPSMIVNPFQVLVAANKAVHLHRIGKVKTRSLYSEIIYNFSPTNNISEAFKRFGISDSDSAVLIVLVHPTEETHHVTDVMVKVDGKQIPVEDVSKMTDTVQIKKLYKTTPQEDKCLLDAVVCRMAIKDVI